MTGGFPGESSAQHHVAAGLEHHIVYRRWPCALRDSCESTDCETHEVDRVLTSGMWR